MIADKHIESNMSALPLERLASQSDGIIVPARGFNICIPRDEAYLYYATFIAGQYSQLAIKRGDVVLDAGANVGDFTLLASAAVGGSGKVLAVEPNSRAVEYLRDNLARNRIENVEIIEAFIGSTSRKVESVERGTYSSIVPAASANSLQAEELTLDEIARRSQIVGFDVVKMDIEGSELDALRGCKDLRRIRELSIEVHSPYLEREVRALLQGLGFRCETYDSARLVAHVLRTMLVRPTDFVTAERKFRWLALASAIRALGGHAPSPSLSPGSGVRMLHFQRFSKKTASVTSGSTTDSG